MKAVILAGGFGTRISEESHLKPKPMIEIGSMPILWHIMKLYSYYNINEFVICAGYKQEVIKEWFSNYFIHTSDVTFDFTKGRNIIVHRQNSERWKVTIVDTGRDTLTAGRISRVREFIDNNPFFLTYGDGVSNVNLDILLKYHKKHGRMVTITCYNQEQRFGVINMNKEGQITDFREKSASDNSLINIGYMVVEPEIFQNITDDSGPLEKEIFPKIAERGELQAYEHKGFWHCMDTKRDHEKLNKMWESNNAAWKVWKD